MARDVDSTLQTHLESGDTSPVMLIKCEFDSGDLNLWTGWGDLSFDGDTYTGAGDLLGLAAFQEKTDLRAIGHSFILSGMPVALLALAQNEDYQDRPIHAWIGAFKNGALDGTPYKILRGRMDVMTISTDGQTASIRLDAENRLIDLQRENRVVYSDQWQQGRYAGDLYFEFLPGIGDLSVRWGRQ